MRLLSTEHSSVCYLLKDRVCDIAEHVDAVRRVSDGQPVIDPAVISQVLAYQGPDNRLARLSGRECEVLSLMAEGLNQSIREKLFLSERTVEAHVRSIFSKLDLVETAGEHRRVLAALRPHAGGDPVLFATKTAMRTLGRRVLVLDQEKPSSTSC